MRNKRNLIALVVAVVCWLLALIIGAQALRQYDSTTVVVVSRQVPAGTPLTPALFREVKIPAGGKPASAFSNVQEVTGFSSTTLFVGEYLLREHVQEKPALPDITSALTRTFDAPEPGEWRVVSLKLPPEAVLNGHLRPGDWVDLYSIPASVTSSAADGLGGQAELIAPRLLVLDIRNSRAESVVGTTAERGAFSGGSSERIPATVTLQVPAGLMAEVLGQVHNNRTTLYLALAARS